MDTTASGSELELTIDTFEVGGEFVAVCQEFPSLAGRAMDATEARDTLLRNIQEHLGESCSIQEEPFVADTPLASSAAEDAPSKAIGDESRSNQTSGMAFAMSFLRWFAICMLIAVIARVASFPPGARISPALLISDTLGLVLGFGLFVCLPAFVLGLMRRIGKGHWPAWKLELLCIPFAGMLLLAAYGERAVRGQQLSPPSRLPTTSSPSIRLDTSRETKASSKATEQWQAPSRAESNTTPELIAHTPFRGVTIKLPQSWVKTDQTQKNAVLDRLRDSIDTDIAEKGMPSNEGTVIFQPADTPDGTNIVLIVREQKSLSQDTLARLTSADLQTLKSQMLTQFSRMNGTRQLQPNLEIRVGKVGSMRCIEVSCINWNDGEGAHIQNLRIPLGTRTVTMVLTRPVTSNRHAPTLNLARNNLKIEE